MNLITGKIDIIELATLGSNQKKILTLIPDSGELCWIEFRGSTIMKLLDDVKKGDRVEVAVKFEGKVSKSSGIRYNNLVAKELKKQ